MKAVADFWVSRVTRNDDGSYSICNVVGADEYANGVDDNAFTNGAAIRLWNMLVRRQGYVMSLFRKYGKKWVRASVFFVLKMESLVSMPHTTVR